MIYYPVVRLAPQSHMLLDCTLILTMSSILALVMFPFGTQLVGSMILDMIFISLVTLILVDKLIVRLCLTYVLYLPCLWCI